MELHVGMRGTIIRKVDETSTAASFGSGGVRVFATPLMIGMMEGAACSAIHPFMEDGKTTVGTTVDIKHMSATPVGMNVSANAELIEIDGRRLVFKVEAFDDKDKIGEGTHERFIIDTEKFMQKTEAKLS